MTERAWRTLGEFTQADAPGYVETLTEQLTIAVRDLNVPVSVVKRMQAAVIAAVRRSFQRDNTRTAAVTVSAQVPHPEEGPIDHSWGLFLVEKGTEGLAPHRIAVMLYPDQVKSTRRPTNGDMDNGEASGAVSISAAHST